MEDGWIKLWRKSKNSKIFVDEELWKLWTLCLMKASHKECFISVDGIKEPVKLEPGQFITGRYSLHQDYYPRKKKNQKSPLTLWKWMKILEKCENLNINSNNKYSVVTIINWHRYQNQDGQKEHQIEQQRNNRGTTEEQQRNTNKNVYNGKNDKNGKEYITGQAKKILQYLNEKKGSKYEDYSFIVPRLKEGKTVADCIQVIDNKFKDPYFKKNPKYLCPETLFRKSKFDKYLNEVSHPLSGKVSDTTLGNIEALNEWERMHNGE